MGERGPDFAVRLRQVMAELNVSRLTLSRELGVDKSVIGRWLGGTNQPTGHNLTRLTDIVRRYRPEVTVEFWERPLAAPLNGGSHSQRPPEGLSVTGLHAERRPEIDANYPGLWGGFYQSTQNRGSVVLAVMYIWEHPAGLRATFTEGKVNASGAALAIGPRLHAILEIEPMHDRLCQFVFNGVGSTDAVVMDGIYMISAGDATTCAAASPVVLFRIGDAADYARIGEMAGVMRELYPANARNVQASELAADPVAGLAELVPEPVLRRLCAQVGTRRADGEIDHILRMPASRALPAGNFGLAELPASSPILATRTALRRILGLE